MGLGLKIGEEFLVLPPEAEMQMELNNPLLDFGNDVVGEYSYPIGAKLTPKNLKILQGSGLLQKRETNPGIEAQAYDGTLQYSTGKLKIEKTQPNLNNRNNTGLNLIYLSGYSSFYQDIKDLKLKDVDVGGDRIFAGDNLDRNGAGFWGHIHKVIDAPAGYGQSGYDYAFFPLLNESYGRRLDDDREMINMMKWQDGNVQFGDTGISVFTPNVICPFPYLKYVLLKAMDYIGWRIEGAILNDDQFCKITMINSLAINWGYNKNGNPASRVMYSQIKFNLRDHLPDLLIKDFLLALRNRFGWWYDFDKKKKLIRITQMKDSLNGEQKDFTRFVNPYLEKTVLTEKKVYALEADGGSINLTGMDYKGQVSKFENLPAAAEALANNVYLVADENNYYFCDKDDNDVWLWSLSIPGTGGYDPGNSTDSIKTDTKLVWTKRGFSFYLDFVPQWDEFGYWPGQMEQSDYSADLVLSFYWGKRNNKLGQPVPFGSHHIYDSVGNVLGTWSLAFKAKGFDGNETGLYDTNWKPALDKLSVGEEIEIHLVDFPVEEWLNLKWNDELIIDGVKLDIKTQKPVLPFKKTLDLMCIRL